MALLAACFFRADEPKMKVTCKHKKGAKVWIILHIQQ